MTTLKTFDDLIFHRFQGLMPDQPNEEGQHAIMYFLNGFGISVIKFIPSGYSKYFPELIADIRKNIDSMRDKGWNDYINNVKHGSYTSNDQQWEVALLIKDAKDLRIDNVIGYCSAEQVTEIMKQIQELPPISGDTEELRLLNE